MYDIKWIKMACIKILPTVYDDSISYYEFLCKVCERINEMIENINNIPETIEEILKNYLDSDAFREWIESLIQSYITSIDDLPRSNDIDIHRVFSKVEKSSIKFPSEVHYNVPQSCCYIPEENSVIVGWGPEGDLSITSSLAKLIEYNLSDFSIKREATIAVYHANGMTYDPQKKLIYVCGLNEFSSGKYGFLSVDYKTLTNIEEHELTFNPVGCGMNEELGLIYFSGSNNQVQVVRNSDYTAVREFALNKPENTGTVLQDIDVYNNLIFAIYWRPANICVYDTQGNLVRIYNIPDWWDGLYRSKEPESLCHIGNGKFIITDYLNFESQHYTGTGMFGLINFNKNVSIPGLYPITYYSTQFSYDMYVDSSENNKTVNPDGSEDNPFRSVQEAFETIKSPFIPSNVLLNIIGGTKEPYPVSIYGIDKTIRLLGTYVLDNISINYCKELILANTISFDSTVQTNSCVSAFASKIIFDHNEINRGNCTYDISGTWSELLLSYSAEETPKTGITSTTLNLSTYNQATNNITPLDSANTINAPIIAASGQFTETFNTNYNPKYLGNAILVIFTNSGRIELPVNTAPVNNRLVHFRYPSGNDIIDVFFDIMFSATQVILSNISYLTNNADSSVGFPSGVYIEELRLQ